MDEKLSREAVYYLDACILIDMIENGPKAEPAKTIKAVMEDAERGRFRLVTSVATIAEVL